VTTRDRSVIMVLGLLAMVAAFWFLLLSPKREDVASVKDQVAAAQTRLDVANAFAASAAAAKAKYAADYRAVTDLGKAVPADDDVPSLVFQLQTASQDSRIEFDSIKLTGAAAPAAQAPAAPTTPTAQAGQLAQEQKGATTGATPATTPAPSTAAGTTTAAATPAVAAAQTAFAGLPPGATVGPAGLPTMPFDFEFSGPFLRLEKLLKRIAAFTKTDGGQINVNGRLMTIDSISLSGFPKMKATIHATAFVVPDGQGLLNGATAQGPATAVPAVAAAPGGTPVAPVATATPAVGVGR
jgi:hypothetical protein